MRKKIRKIKTMLIILLLTITLVTIYIPSVSASLFKVSANLSLQFDVDVVKEKIVPLSGTKKIPLTVGYQVVGTFAKQVAKRFSRKGIPATIELSVEETPAGCTAIIEPSILKLDAEANWNFASTNLFVSLNEEIPADTMVEIRVKMHAEQLSSSIYKIAAETQYKDIAVIAGFLAAFDVTPMSTSKEVSPGENAYFDIKIENLGNTKTTFSFNILKKPEGWNVNIAPNIILGTKSLGEDSTEMVQLFVQSPSGFVYNDDREVFQVSVKATQYDYPSAQGEEMILSFTVKSNGFSVLGVVTIFLPFVFIAAIILFYYQKKYRKIII